MNNTLRRSLFCTTAITALAMAGSHSAMAVPVLGGGSTLAALTYVNEFTDAHTTTFTYCSVGSGAGTSAFVSNSDTPLHADTVTPTCSSLTGKTVDYGASDAYISGADLTTFGTSAGPMIQIPMFGTPVAFPFNTATASSNGAETLTDAQLCGIFSGKITDWQTVDPTKFTSATPLKVAYRVDGSGTSFLLTSHLKLVCTDGTTFTSTQRGVMPTTGFAAVFGGTVPGNFVGGTGSSGVLAAIQATTNSIGYLSPDYTDISANGHTAGYPHVAAVKNDRDGTIRLPNITDTAAALSTIAIPTLANETNQTNWAPPLVDNGSVASDNVSNPAKGYPVAGYTYFYLATCYSNLRTGVAADVRTFLNAHFNVAGSSNSTVVKEITNSGFLPVPGSSASAAPVTSSYAAALVAAFLTGDSNNLEIAETGTGSANTRCTSIAGR